MNSSNGTLWECIFIWTLTFALLNSLINPLLYGWRVQEIREVVESTFKWNENSRRQYLRTDIIEMNELNSRKRVNLRAVGGVGEGFSGAFADDARRPRNRENETELITETCINSNILTGVSKNPSQNILEDTDSEGDNEPNERFSEGKVSKKEPNEITVAAILHCNPVTNNEISESIIEDGCILPQRITHQDLTTEEAEKEGSPACLVKTEANTESLGNRRSTEINELLPTLATIIEKEKPDKISATRQHLQNIEAERIEVIDSEEYQGCSMVPYFF